MTGEFTVNTILTFLLLLKSKNGEHQIYKGFVLASWLLVN